mgnify:CR=1 FL=1
MLFVLIACCTFAQTNKDSSHFTQVTHIKTSLKHFTTDKLRQFYIVSPTNELIKYSREGKELFRYINNWLGELAIVDATNPFNLFLYNPEYMTVITLDRTLNETSTFNFFDLDLTDVRAVGMSNDNNIWLYDDLRFTLKKIDRQGNVLLESGNLNLTLGHRIAPNAIVERTNQEFNNDPENRILDIDNFANNIQTLPLKKMEYIQEKEDIILKN